MSVPQPNMDQFEAYFRRADLDQDGRISGNEAVAFLQGSNLPRPVLAQIWVIADQNRTGFLGRQEFYNALKLVTVAQSKRELTPDIVKAALYGPASAAIPPPRINLTPTQSQQSSVHAASSSVPPPSVVTAIAPRNVGAGGPQGFASQQTQLMTPTRPLSPSTLQSPQGVARPTIPPLGGNSAVSFPTSASTSPGGSTAVSNAGFNSQLNKAMIPSIQDGLVTLQSGLLSAKQPVSQVLSPSVQPDSSKPNDMSAGGEGGQKDSRALSVGGNGHTSDLLFGDVFSASPVQTKLDSTKVNSVISSAPAPSAIVPASSESQSPAKSSSFESLRSTPTQQPISSEHSQIHILPKSDQHSLVQASALPTGATTSGRQSQPSWPRMTQSDVQKYNKVFMQVDTDRDGKITGEQARNLFLSWRIPRDVLKQVWDLSDQDNDSMLSLREFCIALYLMERYREGRPLPAALPNDIMLDETVFAVSSQPAAALGNAVWKATPGFQQPQVPRGARGAPFAGVTKPPRPVPTPQLDDAVQPNRQKPKVPVLEKHLLDQLSTEEQNSLHAKLQEATEAEKKVAELEKEISDAREKTQFYHSKMQELILYKSRCDNRLNEIYQRVSADKLEVDKLGKKYEEKCRQSGDVASKLTREESTFRDIQEKKMELYRAIVKLQQEGSADKFQERASQIQVDLEELVKSLNERCKTYGLRAKPTSLVELPFGWQPGIQGAAADWEENWDKFEDEGFTVVKELTSDVQDVIAPPKPKSALVRDKETSDGHVKAEKVQQTEEKKSDDGENTHGEDGKPDGSPESPTRGDGPDSKSNDIEDSKKNGSFDGSPHATQSEHGGTESVLSGDKEIDDPAWGRGRFDNQYNFDAAWDINGASTKDSDSLFGTDGWNLQPIKTGSSSTDNTHLTQPPPFFDSVPSTPLNNSGSSPQADNLFQRKSPFFDSVPSTPLYNSGSTPHADNLFQRTSPFFDSVPSTPMYNSGTSPRADNSSMRTSPFFDSVPSTPLYNSGNTPHADNFSVMKSPFGGFADSVPSTPMYNSGSSPRRLSEASENQSFDNFSRFDSFNMQESSRFSRFDSFNMQDGGLFTPRDSSVSGFDSMRSTKDSEYDHGGAPFASRDSFARFDSFRSTADSDYNFGAFPPPETLTRFDSIRSTRDADNSHGFSSFDDADPFGSHDPFKTSTENQTPRRDSDSWRAF